MNRLSPALLLASGCAFCARIEHHTPAEETRETVARADQVAPSEPSPREAAGPPGGDVPTQPDLAPDHPPAPGDPEFALWAKQVQSALQAHFEPPNDAGDVSCGVRVRVDPTSGAVESYELTVSSGIPAFDAAALRALVETRSIPLPPDRYRGILADQGMAIRLHAK